MRRRALKAEAEKIQFLRIRLEDVYGGVIAERAKENAALHELAASIARRGLLQPIVVRHSGQNGRYVLVCGTRRLAACRLLGMHEINAVLIDADAQEGAACFIEEHFVRTQLPALDAAEAVKLAGEADVFAGKKAEVQVGMLRHLNMLTPKTKQIVRRYGLSCGQAYPLTLIENPVRQQEAAMIIAERALTSEQAHRLAVGMPDTMMHKGERKKSALKMALEEIRLLARRMRTQGVDATVSVYSQEGGLCIQFLLQNGEKVNDWQENRGSPRNIKSAVLHDR